MTQIAKDLFTGIDSFHAITVGAYQMMGRLEDIPLTTDYEHTNPQSCSCFNDIFDLAYQSASIGYYFKEKTDHMSTTAISDEQVRLKLAEEGMAIINQAVEQMNLPHVTEQMRHLEAYNQEVEALCPWVPSAN